ncbi:hypothetical protein OKW41_009283 [Paraburkholderia sp. UCT70]
MHAPSPRTDGSTPSTSRFEGKELGLPVPQRYWAMLVIALSLTLAVLDSAIANVALPTIARNLNASAAASIWVVNAYQLAITISLLPLASLGDRIGYRRIYLSGLILFTVASFGCALSNSLAMLALARVVQGFGAAGIMSVNTAIVRMIYPPYPARARRLDQRDGGGGVVGGRADGRLGRARDRDLAVAVRDQRADRNRGDRRRLQGAADEPRPRIPV